MSVRKRTWRTSKGEAKEAWIVDYVDQQGDRHIETFERKKDADAYQATVKVDVSKGIHTAPSKSLTVLEAADVWINKVIADDCERTTIDQYRQHVRLHIAPRIGKLKLAQLTTPQMKGFADELLKTTSRPMARKVLTSIKSMFKVSGYSHIVLDVKIKNVKRDKRKLEIGIDIPTPGEVKRAIDSATDLKRRGLLMTVALTGLRASELRGLRWADVDFKNEEIHVRQRADRYNQIGSPKSVSSQRTIPMGPQCLAVLREWKLACPKGEANLVFPTSSGKADHHANLLRGLVSTMTAAGLLVPVKDGKGATRRDEAGEPLMTPKYALHSFRHYFASWCINPASRGGRQLPPKEVQELMGHSSIVMTLDLYGHLFPRGNDKAELASSEAAMFA